MSWSSTYRTILMLIFGLICLQMIRMKYHLKILSGSVLRRGVVDIGKVLLVLSPWNDPQPIRRAWCLFEIFNALDERDVKLEIGLPSNEIEQMRVAVINSSDCLINALTDIQAQKAEAKVEEDRKLIFDVIKKSEGGFAHVNQQVKKGLRQRYVETLLNLSEASPVDPNI